MFGYVDHLGFLPHCPNDVGLDGVTMKRTLEVCPLSLPEKQRNKVSICDVLSERKKKLHKGCQFF